MRFARRERRRAGDEIRIARIAAGLSQRELARLGVVSHAAVGRIERVEIRMLTIDRLAVMAAILGLDLRLNLYPTAGSGCGPPCFDRSAAPANLARTSLADRGACAAAG
jgi:transcriptional regulator with XRE-family HTH domain